MSYRIRHYSEFLFSVYLKIGWNKCCFALNGTSGIASLYSSHFLCLVYLVLPSTHFIPSLFTLPFTLSCSTSLFLPLTFSFLSPFPASPPYILVFTFSPLHSYQSYLPLFYLIVFPQNYSPCFFPDTFMVAGTKKITRYHTYNDWAFNITKHNLEHRGYCNQEWVTY